MKPLALLIALLIITWAFIKTPAQAQPTSVPIVRSETPIESTRQVKKSQKEAARKNH
jgi:hypothetical protein